MSEEAKKLNFLQVTFKYYPQRVILLINAAIAAGAYAIDMSQAALAVTWPLVNAILILFYGEQVTNSKAWVDENMMFKPDVPGGFVVETDLPEGMEDPE